MLRLTGRDALVLVWIFLWAASAAAQSGAQDYQQYCAACHGRDGKGTGAWWRGSKVPDLTRLSQMNGGKFPSEEVYEVVDGRSRSRWHQRRRDMPYWGEVFQLEEGNPAAKGKVESRITAIVDYIRSLQQK